jgi:hypothetical protein
VELVSDEILALEDSYLLKLLGAGYSHDNRQISRCLLLTNELAAREDKRKMVMQDAYAASLKILLGIDKYGLPLSHKMANLHGHKW